MMKRFIAVVSCLVLALALALSGCAASATAKVCVFEAGLNGQIHEWQDVGATFDCDDADPPCRSSVTAGFVTVGSDITLGGKPNGVGLGIDVTWDNKD